MKIEVKVPTVGESITEATIGQWLKKSGEMVKRNETLLLLETDKASVEVAADADGVLQISAEAGQTVKIGSTVATIDSDAKASVSPAAPTTTAPAKESASAPAPKTAATPQPPANQAPAGASRADAPLSPAVQRIIGEKGLDPAAISGTGKDGRLTKGDVLQASPGSGAGGSMNAVASPQPTSASVLKMPSTPSGGIRKVPMTTIRKRIAERLLQAQQNAAILTTFNEIDMTKILDLRARYKDKFKEKYGVNLGMMGLFCKASIEALKAVPSVNAWITGTDMEYHDYYNIGIAVSTERGLMVPVIKNADQMSVAQIELAIRDFALKARDGKITVDDLNGGTFSLTNGGVFGSLLSTPILNAPQSAILGMHKIEDRAVVIDKKIEIRSMMYVALSYDHRIIDGKEAVTFLVKIKEGIEDPERLLLEI